MRKLLRLGPGQSVNLTSPAEQHKCLRKFRVTWKRPIKSLWSKSCQLWKVFHLYHAMQCEQSFNNTSTWHLGIAYTVLTINKQKTVGVGAVRRRRAVSTTGSARGILTGSLHREACFVNLSGLWGHCSVIILIKVVEPKYYTTLPNIFLCCSRWRDREDPSGSVPSVLPRASPRPPSFPSPCQAVLRLVCVCVLMWPSRSLALALFLSLAEPELPEGVNGWNLQLQLNNFSIPPPPFPSTFSRQIRVNS